MRYVGSKSRISKELAPVIQQYVDEPWCKRRKNAKSGKTLHPGIIVYSVRRLTVCGFLFARFLVIKLK